MTSVTAKHDIYHKRTPDKYKFGHLVTVLRPLSREPLEQVDLRGLKGIYYLKVISRDGVQMIRLMVQ